MKRRVLIIGAGPAGLTAALELLRRSDEHEPVIIEALDQVGGLARTVRHGGNRIDIGGHRFFSKVDWVMDWWREILPVPEAMRSFAPVDDPSRDLAAADALAALAPEKSMLVRPRLSRIYHLRRFFGYPIRLSATTIANLGIVRVARIAASYARSRVFPIRPERNLEDFFVNRFGRMLYRTFFKDYTEKVWGVSCDTISPQWGAQRVKGLSIARAIAHALKRMQPASRADIGQKGVETSLIERFLYPKHGPGQMWEEVARIVVERGARLSLSTRVLELRRDGDRVAAVVCATEGGAPETIECDAVISSMAVRDLVAAMAPPAPPPIREIAQGLVYRNFITVGVLLARLRPSAEIRQGFANNMFPDNWIYIQESDVRVGRIQIFNNWSPGMVADMGRIWMGLEYFCSDGDDLWSATDDALVALARRELAALGFADAADILDTRVLRAEKAYPAYFGSYDRFDELRGFLDSIRNLYPVGRNGMHRYNNQDHSMVSARLAVLCILDPARSKSAIWDVNVEQEYHEETGARSSAG